MKVEQLFTDYPYCLKAREKKKLLAELLWKLTLHHKRHCRTYRNILEALPNLTDSSNSMEDLPMLPVRLFKAREFSSVPQESVIRILKSSGTTAQIPSHIAIDKNTIELEKKAFASVVRSVIGRKSLPMILVDSSSVAQDKDKLNVRSYTLRGWKNLSSNCLFLLDKAMNIKWKELNSFLKRYKGKKIVLFGLTFIIWQYLYQTLVKKRRRLDLGQSILFHTGGWKRLRRHGQDKKEFNLSLSRQLGLKQVYNFYGMTELIGTIFLECEQNHFHAPDFADIMIRDYNSLNPLSRDHKGLIQVFNPLAQSFPGHSLLTEDLGAVLGEDNCPCGRKGKYFRLCGRMPWAEIRGCSNTYAEEFYSRNSS